jgi:hypothetical protein
MKKLSKAQQTTHETISAKLSGSREDLKGAVSTFNDKVAALFAEIVQPEVDAFNAAATESNEFLQEVHEEMDSFYEDRSDKWKEGDAGSAYEDWKSSWEMEIGEVELEEPAAYDEPEMDGVDEFEELALEADS